MKKYLLMASLLMAGVMPMMAEIEDDIYYDPRKVAHKSNQDNARASNNQSNYIANYQDIDVDDYNARGQYYVTPIDTIGSRIENGEDFVYTTQIQKYYNPTIVIDNKEILADILENSYGNVTIEYDFFGLPTFARWYAGFYNNLFYPYYGYYSGPYWAWSVGPVSIGWNWGWNWGWNIGWNNPWDWGWGPSWSWGWGPSYYPGYWRPNGPNYWASNRPGGNRPAGPRPGWSHNSRPQGNMANHNVGGRPGNNSRPTMGSIGGSMNQTNQSYGRQPGQGAYNSSRPGSTTANRYESNSGSNSSTRPGGYSIGGDGHRRYGTSESNGISNGQGSYRTQGSTGSSSGSYRQNGNSSTSGRQSGQGAYQSGRPGSSSSNATRNSGSSYNSGNSSRNSGSYTRNSGSSSYNSGNSYNSGSSSRSSSSYNSGSYSSGGHRSSGGSFSGGGSRGGGYSGGGSRGGRR